MHSTRAAAAPALSSLHPSPHGLGFRYNSTHRLQVELVEVSFHSLIDDDSLDFLANESVTSQTAQIAFRLNSFHSLIDDDSLDFLANESVTSQTPRRTSESNHKIWSFRTPFGQEFGHFFCSFLYKVQQCHLRKKSKKREEVAQLKRVFVGVRLTRTRLKS